MIVHLADGYFLSLSTLRQWHTTKTMTVLQKVDNGLKSRAKCYHIKQLKASQSPVVVTQENDFV